MRLKPLTNFACYYGRDHLAELANYNLAILQVEQYAPEELAALSSHDVTIVAYLSLGEVPVAESDDRWIFRDPETGESVLNTLWGTVAVDCRSEPWHQHLLEERIPELLSRGATGLFLDTVDIQETLVATRPGVTALLRRIRREHPNTVIVVNRGFAILDTVLAVADAVAFEAFSSHYDGATYTLWRDRDLAWTAQMAARLNQTRGNCPVLTIDYAGPDDHALRERAVDRARRYGFIPFVGTYALDWLPEAH
jgi:polysaccharide biosynthesis protein PelA